MSEVELSIRDGVAVVRLNAPSRRNALTVEMAHELVAACDQVAADASIGALVIAGSGGYFCAGGHRELLAQAGRDPASSESYEALGAIYRSFARVTEMDVLSIAAVRGGAVGAGINLMLACSMRIVSVDARIIPGFRRVGLHPGGGNLALLNRALGHQATVALGVLDLEVSGARAAALGLAWEAVPDEEVEGRALALAALAAEDAGLARLVMHSLRVELGPPSISLEAALDLERAAQMRSLRRKDEQAAH